MNPAPHFDRPGWVLGETRYVLNESTPYANDYRVPRWSNQGFNKGHKYDERNRSGESKVKFESGSGLYGVDRAEVAEQIFLLVIGSFESSISHNYTYLLNSKKERIELAITHAYP